jgi:DNA modification methylase
MSNSAFNVPVVNLDRMPPSLRRQLNGSMSSNPSASEALPVNAIHCGDARQLLPKIRNNSVAVSVWSPPYFVGKSYESDLAFEEWQALLRDVIALHFPVIKPGGFLVINIADILCFKDESMPKIQAANVSRHKSPVTRDQVLEAMRKHPTLNRYQIAELLGCSEQTIDRRLNGNNIRGGKYETQTRVKIVGGLIEEWAIEAGFYPYDRRIWVKDAAWENSKWATLSYRSVDEFEYIYVFWKPGVTNVDRGRLSPEEWRDWGARGVWSFPSVRANDDHEAKFPLELPRRVIRLFTDPGETVLDCFIGSGTTAIAAFELGRNYLGIELLASYAKLAKQRVAEAEATPRLFPLPNANRSSQPKPRSRSLGADRKGVASPRLSSNSRLS